MKIYRCNLLALIFAIVLQAPIITAQQKTGNIVAYFGKEKVEEIHEGKLIHVFTEGLVLKLQEPGFNSSTFPSDPVFERFLMNPGYRPQGGEAFDVDYMGNTMKWTTLGTDRTNTFTEAGTRSSYLVLTYRSGSAKDVIFEASGHTVALINGLPHEGDHYDFGYSLIPIRLKRGINTFVLKAGRFSRIRARILDPHKPVQFTSRDLTMPDILIEESKSYLGGVRIVNSSDKWIRNHSVKASLSGNETITTIPAIPPHSTRKVAIEFEAQEAAEEGADIIVQLVLQSALKRSLAALEVTLKAKSKYKHHKKTFLSSIDGSVQYYSVAPSKDKTTDRQALFLSVHGASVEAVNQANAYKQKDWGNIVAPTNRRPFGFAWEDWGRLDALEVLQDAKRIYNPDPQRIYLTGHSMGGHGTWYLGATYPDYFAAIAPCAGYPDLLSYRDSFIKRMLNGSPEQLARRGFTKEQIERLKNPPDPNQVELMITRAGTPNRTLKLIRNYLHFGVYILHGEKDNVVPTFLARDMRRRLGKFHNDFTYYEYPDGTHWYGDHSMDWPPIFDFFKQRTIKQPEDLKKLEFFTGSPGISAKSGFVTIHQQEKPFMVSSIKFSRESGLKVETENVEVMELAVEKLKDSLESLVVDKDTLSINPNTSFFLKKDSEQWNFTKAPAKSEKGPHRYGGFKDAFKNNMVFVYATQGTMTETTWYYNKARFDAETFYYKANGNVEIVRDIDFNPSNYPDRNVIVYGNRTNNAAWDSLLGNSPILVMKNKVTVGGKELNGDQWGAYFIVPRADSDKASIGVVTATGSRGMKAAYANHYLVNGTTFPDLLLFDDNVLLNGTSEVKCAGFFGNDWSVETGDFKWR
jgi:predicted esterase